MRHSSNRTISPQCHEFVCFDVLILTTATSKRPRKSIGSDTCHLTQVGTPAGFQDTVPKGFGTRLWWSRNLDHFGIAVDRPAGRCSVTKATEKGASGLFFGTKKRVPKTDRMRGVFGSGKTWPGGLGKTLGHWSDWAPFSAHMKGDAGAFFPTGCHRGVRGRLRAHGGGVTDVRLSQNIACGRLLHKATGADAEELAPAMNRLRRRLPDYSLGVSMLYKDASQDHEQACYG